MNDVSPHWEKVLQGLSHWVAYKKQYFDAHSLPEGAIVAELTQLLSAKLPNNLIVECERYYKDFYGSDNENRVDICIGEKPSKGEFKYGRRVQLDGLKEIIEVKRLNNDFSPVRKDFNKVYDLKCKLIPKFEIKTYVLVVGQNGLSEYLFKGSNTLKRDLSKEGSNFEAKTKMTKKAYNTSKLAMHVSYAALIEVK